MVNYVYLELFFMTYFLVPAVSEKVLWRSICTSLRSNGTMQLEYQVLLRRKAEQELDDLPLYIVNKFRGWIKFVELYGIREARLIKSFHDEALKGKRQGQRSIRLNRSYRAIYIELLNNEVEIIEVIEVHKHDY